MEMDMINIDKDNVKFKIMGSKDIGDVVAIYDNDTAAVFKLLDMDELQKENEDLREFLNNFENVKIPRDLSGVAALMKDVVKLNYVTLKLFVNEMVFASREDFPPKAKNFFLKNANFHLHIADTYTKRFADLNPLWFRGKHNGMSYHGANPYNYFPSLNEIPNTYDKIMNGEEVYDKVTHDYGNYEKVPVSVALVDALMFGRSNFSMTEIDKVGSEFDKEKPLMKDVEKEFGELLPKKLNKTNEDN